MTAREVISDNVRATARLIRRIDDGDRTVFSELAELYPRSGNAYVIGVTGSPGVGKSTLVDCVVSRFRKDGKTVGVLAVDPTSPFTGGAILGDRVRMQRHSLDNGVFIRSLATRGAFGGLTRSTADAVIVLDAMGTDVIIIETVGVGQDEVDIVNNAHTTVLVTIPGMGDDIQAMKAGLMEIGDLFVVNKADLPAAGKTVHHIKSMLLMAGERQEAGAWDPPVLRIVAVEEKGISELYQAILDHRQFLLSKGRDRLKELEVNRARKQLLDLLKEGLLEGALEKVGGMDGIEGMVQEIAARKKDPYRTSSDLVRELLGGSPC